MEGPDEIIHQSMRLRIAASLNALPNGELLEFGKLKSMLGATDGNMATHLGALEKAGYIAVDRRGRRFISEARSYHDFVPALVEACRGDPVIECHLVCDARAIRQFGLGMAPPAPGRLGPHIRTGYIKRADTLDGLADACGIDREGLAATVARWNAGAARGEDGEFGKGGDVYERFNGGGGSTGNPCVAPIIDAPFYAIRLIPGDIGTFIGLRTDQHARALDSRGAPIPGLLVAGNDAASLMGGSYPGAGITLGPALVFGHIAADTAASYLSNRSA